MAGQGNSPHAAALQGQERPEGVMSESSQPAHPVDKPGRLAELEKVIARQTYKQRGSALAEISNNQLYKPEFTNFDDYCVIRWGFQSKYRSEERRVGKE